MVEAKRVTPRVKHIDIPVCFIQYFFDNGLFVTKNDKSSVMPKYIFNKPRSVLNISWINNWTTGFRFYPSNNNEHYQLMKLHEFDVT